MLTQDFDTDAALAGATVADGVNIVNVGGKATPGDGGHAGRVFVDSNVNPAPTDVVTSNAKRFRLLERVLRPGHFGIYPTTTDVRQGLADLAAELTWRGGGRFEFDDCKTYTFCPTAPEQGAILVNLQDINGLTIGFNGSKLVTPADYSTNRRTLTTNAGSPTVTVNDPSGIMVGDTFNGPNLIAVSVVTAISGATLTLGFAAARTGTAVPHYFRRSNNDAKYLWAFALARCKNFTLRNPWIEHTYADFKTTLDPHTGVQGLSIGEGCSDGQIVGTLRQVGGRKAISVSRTDTWTQDKRSHHLRLACDTDYTFYGCFLERNGDFCEVEAVSHHAGRTAGCYGMSNAKFHVHSRAGDSYDDFLITSSASPLDSPTASATTGIEAYYRWRPDPVNHSPKGTLVDIGFVQAVPASPLNGICDASRSSSTSTGMMA